jgi:hypothetical protein
LSWCKASNCPFAVPTVVQYQVSQPNISSQQSSTRFTNKQSTSNRPQRSRTVQATVSTKTTPFPHDLASRITIDTAIAKKLPLDSNDSEFYIASGERGRAFLYSSDLPPNLEETNNGNQSSQGSHSSYNSWHQYDNSDKSTKSETRHVMIDSEGEEYTSTNSNTNLFTQQLIIPPSSDLYYREISPEFISIFRCYQILHKARVPLYVHDQIISTVGKEIVSNGFNPFQTTMKRKAFVKELCNQFKTAKPTFYPVHLESHLNDESHTNHRLLRDEVEVVCFDFKEQFTDLLADTELFGNLNNLVVNAEDENRWMPYENKKGTIF